MTKITILKDKIQALESELEIVVDQIFKAKDLDELKELTKRNFPDEWKEFKPEEKQGEWIEWNKKLDADRGTPDISNDALIEYKLFNGATGRLEFGDIEYRAWGNTGNRIIAYRIIPEQKEKSAYEIRMEYEREKNKQLTKLMEQIVINPKPARCVQSGGIQTPFPPQSTFAPQEEEKMCNCLGNCFCPRFASNLTGCDLSKLIKPIEKEPKKQTLLEWYDKEKGLEFGSELSPNGIIALISEYLEQSK